MHALSMYLAIAIVQVVERLVLYGQGWALSARLVARTRPFSSYCTLIRRLFVPWTLILPGTAGWSGTTQPNAAIAFIAGGSMFGSAGRTDEGKALLFQQGISCAVT